MFNKLRRLIRPIIGNNLFIFLVGAGLFYWLYIYKLGSSTKGLSAAEVAAASNSSSLGAIVDDPLYAPHKAMQYGLSEIFGYHPWSIRLASVIFAGIFLICFYALCARWFGRLIGTVSTLSLAALPWVCLLGRHATPSILLLISILVLFSYYWFARATKYKELAWLFFCLCIGLALYTPGLVWALMIGVIINRRSLISSIKRLKIIYLLSGGLIVLLMLGPLVWAFYKNPALLYHWTLIPAHWIGLAGLANNLGWAISSLFFRTEAHIEWLVGRLPLLTVLTAALAVFGAYAMKVQARQKLYAIAGLALFGVIASALNDNYVYLSFCLIPIMLLMAAGLRFLFLQWQSVFPRNPIPRYFAYGLIISLAVGQIIFGLRASIYAWPNTPETKTIFVLK